MMSPTVRPANYRAYEKIVFCNNTLIGGGNLITIKGVVPLVIGSGERPLIWLKAPMDSSAENYIDLVDASVSQHPLVTIISDRVGLSISVSGTRVLHVVQKNAHEAEVDFLDLRPLGYEVYGDAKSLNAGGMNLSGNVMSNVDVMLVLG